MFIAFENFNDAVGDHVAVRRDDGRQSRLFVPASLKSSPIFGAPVAALAASASILAMAAPKIVEGLSASGWRDVAPKQLAPLGSNFAELQRSAIARAASLRTQRKEWQQSPLPLTNGAEIRSYLRSIKPADAFRYAIEHHEAARAVIECPSLSGLPADLIVRVEQALVERNLADRYGSTNPKMPDYSDPLADGPNTTLAQSLAAEAIRAYEKSTEEVDDIRTVLKTAVEFTAIVADVEASRAYEMLTAA